MLTTTPAKTCRLLSTAAKKQGETCICDLPEDIMVKIMSTFTVKEVVRASLTFKQWLNLLARLYKVYIRCDMMGGTHSCLDHKDLMIKGVNQFIFSYNKLQAAAAVEIPILNFSLSVCLNKDSAADINHWICFAIQKGVINLVILLECDSNEAIQYKAPSDGHYIFPSHLLNGCQVMLRRLYLMACLFGRNLTAKMAFLEVIYLFHSSLTVSDLDNIFSCCPNLKHLALFLCKLPAKVTVSAKRLTRLRLQQCVGLEEIGSLNSIPLVQFVYCGPRIKFSFASASNLCNLFFCIYSTEEVYDYVFQDVHRDFPSMKSLSVGRWFKNNSSLSHLHGRMYAFQWLESLSIFISAKQTSSFCLLTVLEILKACPLLQSFNMLPSSGQNVENNNIKFSVENFHRNLKFVKISGFCGSLYQIDLVKLLIQASASLEQVVIKRKAEMISLNFLGLSEKDIEWRGDQEPQVVKDTLQSLMKGQVKLKFL